MNQRIEALLSVLLEKRHHSMRQSVSLSLADDFASEGLPPVQRVAERLVRMLSLEKPVILEGQRIVYLRTVRELPGLFTHEEWNAIQKEHFIHEQGCVCNITPDYAGTIEAGLEQRISEIIQSMAQCEARNEAMGLEFLHSQLHGINAVIDLADRYREEAEKAGNSEVASMLGHIPRFGARTFHEALQFFRILHFTLWCEGEYHNTTGRFDQYIVPYLNADLHAGRLDEEGALDLLEEFFISFNWDSDLYPGVQQGDNGQSMVLGGTNGDGGDAFNMLSRLCLKASRDTQQEVYELGTELTKEGLGFPQYSNDETVIPGLIRKRYRPQDARNYAVAACWEFIIPKFGMDIPNIGALSFPQIIDRCLHEDLARCVDFGQFMDCVKAGIREQCIRIAQGVRNLWMIPAPFMSLLMDDCVGRARDISEGARYNNYGIHGTGLTTATDSLAAIRKFVFEEKTVPPCDIVAAVDADFSGYEDLAAILRYESPKMGNDDDRADGIAVDLLDAFADALDGMTNERGGCYRAGTGSAMYYLWHASEIGASPDGRRKGEAFGANYSPSLFARLNGPISIIQSFTKPHLIRAMNGGPLTMEFHGSLFRDEDSTKKVAMLVKSFMDMGGHQLQLNAVNRDELLDAQQHPEKHRNLIVRVWGWSAYFVELDRGYQDHVIRRQEYDF